MIIHWFSSATYRHAYDLRKQVRKEFAAQRDLLSDKARDELSAGLAAFQRALGAGSERAAWPAAMTQLETTALKWLQPYPNAGSRENVKEFLVSAVLIITIFSFFIQPMKIPSGSAQPTLFGNWPVDLRSAPAEAIPQGWGKFLDWFRGSDYHVWVAKDDGVLHIETPTTNLGGLFRQQRLTLGSDSYSIWWPPDNLDRHWMQTGITDGRPYHKGDTILRMRITSGDRLFVDRFTYNFRRPERGETIVFHTAGINRRLRDNPFGRDILTANTHYIKRLVAFGGEKVTLGDDRHLVIDGERLDATTPGFENVYSFQGAPRDSVYSGHVNETVANLNGKGGLAKFFPDASTVFTVRPNHLLAFGDNTMNSYDGRGWGDFPRDFVVGRALFVFWPFSERFGPVYR